jgi:hypothetical protein
MTTTNLTDKEQALLAQIEIGMDEPGKGWLHEIAGDVARAGHEWARNDHAVAAVLGSLLGKKLVWSEQVVERNTPTCYWVSIRK